MNALGQQHSRSETSIYNSGVIGLTLRRDISH